MLLFIGLARARAQNYYCYRDGEMKNTFNKKYFGCAQNFGATFETPKITIIIV